MKSNYRSGKKSATRRVLQGCALLLALVFYAACNRDAKKADVEMGEKKAIYYCPMHPEVQQDHPGKCDKCGGMELVKKEPGDSLRSVLQPVNSAVLADIRTVHPQKKQVPIFVEAQGYIDYDERTKHDISPLFDGRIEKLYVKYNYQLVHRGERLMDIYSPELMTAQENLLYVASGNDVELLSAARQRLKILGMSREQIEQVYTTRRVLRNVPVYSSYEGHIHEMKNAPAPPAEQGMSGGGSTPPSSLSESAYAGVEASVPLLVKEGMYVSKGQVVFYIVDPHKVVVMLQIKEQDIARVKLNQEVSFEVDETPKMTMKGKINFIEPFLKPGSKTLLARIDIDNAEHKHKVGTWIKASITGEPVNGLWVPASAVVDLGRDKIVWLKKDKRFVAQKVQAGIVTKDWVEVRYGLTEEDEVAAEGHYLADSEGFIKADENED
jgi:membrane fusion protein, copper/silver efflux system